MRNYDDKVVDLVTWTVNDEKAGSARLTIRYSNGRTATRPLDTAVNGTVVAAGQAFNPPTNWDTWATVTVTANLNAGANTIKATATTASGGPNVDFLDVEAAGPPPPPPRLPAVRTWTSSTSRQPDRRHRHPPAWRPRTR